MLPPSFFLLNFNPRTPCGVRLVSLAEKGDIDISIHAPLAGCDGRGKRTSGSRPKFQSTHPLRGATRFLFVISGWSTFQSTHPLRGATWDEQILTYMLVFQSTHPLRGATPLIKKANSGDIISIHAPLAGCDQAPHPKARRSSDFNPRTPCGVRLCLPSCIDQGSKFQSTHPLRGATDRIKDKARIIIISIHAPLAGCDYAALGLSAEEFVISIHAPLAGCDGAEIRPRATASEFQSTHPLRGATATSTRSASMPGNFNPRTPCGVRPR